MDTYHLARTFTVVYGLKITIKQKASPVTWETLLILSAEIYFSVFSDTEADEAVDLRIWSSCTVRTPLLTWLVRRAS